MTKNEFIAEHLKVCTAKRKRAGTKIDGAPRFKSVNVSKKRCATRLWKRCAKSEQKVLYLHHKDFWETQKGELVLREGVENG